MSAPSELTSARRVLMLSVSVGFDIALPFVFSNDLEVRHVFKARIRKVGQ
jgi:hypothetical protein